MKKTAFHLLLVILLSSGSAFAWSSPASQTQYRIKEVATAIQSYQRDNGHLPSPATYREDLQKEGYAGPQAFQDKWNQPFVYRVLGTGEKFLYSIGPDGIDNKGAGDDVTEAGANDGYHWKKTWPEGRRLSKLAILVGALCLLPGFYFRWSIVVPLAGIVTGLIMIRSCILLQHPGITSLNDTLGGVVFLPTLFLLGCLFLLFRALRQPADPQPIPVKGIARR